MKKNKNELRIAFMGTPLFAATILDRLLEDGYPVKFVITQNDKPVGRKKILEKTPVKILAESKGLVVFTPEKIDQSVIGLFQENEIDLIVLVAYGKILPKALLEIVPLGAINIHPSLLPKFRGPSPVQNTLLAGETMTGSTIMLMDEGMDTGDILSQKNIPIHSQEIYPELKARLADFSADLLLETLEKFIRGEIITRKQDSLQATYCRLIKREDGQIDWKKKAVDIFSQYRAFYGWPGTFTYWKDGEKEKRLKLNRLEYLEKDFSSGETGKIFLDDNGFPCVQTGKGSLKILEIQPEGKNNMNARDFLKGHPRFYQSQLK